MKNKTTATKRGVQAVKSLVSCIQNMPRFGVAGSNLIATIMDNIQRPARTENPNVISLDQSFPMQTLAKELASTSKHFAILASNHKYISRRTALLAYMSDGTKYRYASKEEQQQYYHARLQVYKLFLPTELMAQIDLEVNTRYNNKHIEQLNLNIQDYTYTPHQAAALNWLNAAYQKSISVTKDKMMAGLNVDYNGQRIDYVIPAAQLTNGTFVQTPQSSTI